MGWTVGWAHLASPGIYLFTAQTVRDSCVGNVSTSTPQFTVVPPQHFLYFLPEPQGHVSFRPTLTSLRRGSLGWGNGADLLMRLEMPLSSPDPLGLKPPSHGRPI